jgi:hypothetical protein
MESEETRFKAREAKRILKDAVRRQYAETPRNPETPRGINSSELVKLAEQGGISQENLDYAVKEHQARRSKLKGRLKGLATTVSIIAGLSLGGKGISSLVNYLNKEPIYVPATVLSTKDVNDVYQLGITFRTSENNNDYVARIICYSGKCIRELDLFRDAVREGSRIEVNREKLDRFENGVGQLRKGDVRILRR